MGTNVRTSEDTQNSSRGWFRIFKVSTKVWVLVFHNRQCCAVLPTWQHCLWPLVFLKCNRSNELSVCHKLLSISCLLEQVCLPTIERLGPPIRAKHIHFRTNLRKIQGVRNIGRVFAIYGALVHKTKARATSQHGCELKSGPDCSEKQKMPLPNPDCGEKQKKSLFRTPLVTQPKPFGHKFFVHSWHYSWQHGLGPRMQAYTLEASSLAVNVVCTTWCVRWTFCWSQQFHVSMFTVTNVQG